MRAGIGLAAASVVLLALGGCARRGACVPRCTAPIASAPPWTEWAEPPRLIAAPPSTEGQVFLDTTILRVPAARASTVLGPKVGEAERSCHVLSEAEAAALRER